MVPGLYKLFDEGVVNCRDMQWMNSHDPNDHKVSKIEVNISDDGIITLQMMVMASILLFIRSITYGFQRWCLDTWCNLNQLRQNGKENWRQEWIWIQTCPIWSTWGKVETVDHARSQVCAGVSSNLTSIDKPSVTKRKVKPYTKVSFKPDYARLGIESLITDMLSLLRRRAYDIAAITDKNVKVKLNDEWLQPRLFNSMLIYS